MGETRKQLMSSCTSAQIAHELQARKIDELMLAPSSFVLCRHHDSTPMYLHFANLAPQLVSNARYPILEQGNWTLVDLSTYMQLYKGAKPSRGVVELFAQHASLHLFDRDGRIHDNDIILKPKLLTSCRAGCIFEAVDSAIPQFSMEALKKLNDSESFRFAVVSELPDGHSANVRKRAATAEKLPGKFLYHDGICGGHKVLPG